MTELGIITTEVNSSSWNAPPPIEVTESGIVTAARPMLTKASSPIEVTGSPPSEEGMLIEPPPHDGLQPVIVTSSRLTIKLKPSIGEADDVKGTALRVKGGQRGLGATEPIQPVDLLEVVGVATNIGTGKEQTKCGSRAKERYGTKLILIECVVADRGHRIGDSH